MKGKITKIILFLALVFLPIGAAKAMDTKTGDSIYIAKDEIVSGNLYAAGNTITVDGNINGDLIAAAQTININGRIEGDIIVAAQNININGEVGGNVRVAGTAITLNNSVARNVTIFGANVVLGNNSNVGWDVFAMGSVLEARGNINGGLSGNAGKALISGKIGKDINLTLGKNNANESLIIAPETIIGGNLIYTAKNPAQISDKINIGGKIEQKIPQTKDVNWLAVWSLAKTYSIFSTLVVGLVLIFLGKKAIPKTINKIKEKSFHALVPGLIIMFILPPLALLLAFTLIGIPLALIVLIWWFIALYVSKIFTAVFVGQLIFKKLIKKDDEQLIWSLIIGVFVCWLLFAIPFVGWIISLIAIWLGLGGFWYYASNQFRNL